MGKRASCRWCVAVALAQNISCKPGNFVELSLGTDMLCGEHPGGRWECFQPDEQGHARRFDIPRDDYLFVSPDGGGACAIRPEDSGVDCFGENAPTPPDMQVAALRYVAPELILAIGLDGAAVSWSASEGYQIRRSPAHTTRLPRPKARLRPTFRARLWSSPSSIRWSQFQTSSRSTSAGTRESTPG